jgi:hypothetical protein
MCERLARPRARARARALTRARVRARAWARARQRERERERARARGRGRGCSGCFPRWALLLLARFVIVLFLGAAGAAGGALAGAVVVPSATARCARTSMTVTNARRASWWVQ